jgi:hypothetical protein
LRGPHNEEWRETNDNPFEKQVPKFVERLFEDVAILKAWHIEQEQDRLHWQEEAERRAERARRQQHRLAIHGHLGLAYDGPTVSQII